MWYLNEFIHMDVKLKYAVEDVDLSPAQRYREIFPHKEKFVGVQPTIVHQCEC